METSKLLCGPVVFVLKLIHICVGGYTFQKSNTHNKSEIVLILSTVII